MDVRTAVLTPIHRRPDLVAEQIANYDKFFRESAVFVLHPSLQGREVVPEVQSRLGAIQERVIICSTSANTSWKCIAGAFIAGTRELRRTVAGEIETVYIHTDGDLLIKGDPATYLAEHALAYGRSPMANAWHWREAALRDTRFRALRADSGIADEAIKAARQEGAFVPFDLWVAAIDLIERYFGDDFFEDRALHWPLEEAVLPTVLALLAPDRTPAKPIVQTKAITGGAPNANPRDQDENCLNVDDIQRIIDDKSAVCAGAKWFSQDIDHPTRALVRSLQDSLAG